MITTSWFFDVLAVAASACLVFFGTGLDPVAWLAFLFPLPMLLLALRRSMRSTAALALLAGTLGTANLWHYGVVTLSMPVPLVAGLLVAQGVLLAATTLTWRSLMISGHDGWAIVCAPAAWVLGEWCVSRSPAVGSWLSLSTSQADNPRLLGLVAVTGGWGLSFVLISTATAVAALLAALLGGRRRALGRGCMVVLGEVAIVVGCIGFAGPSEATGPQVRVGGVVVAQPYDPVDADSLAGRRVVAAYAAQIELLADQGASIVVLPEKVFAIGAVDDPGLNAMRAVADESQIDVVVGAVLSDHGQQRNVALTLRPGDSTLTYAKQHLVPSYESSFTAGHDFVTFPAHGATWAVAICKDLDFPSLTRHYANLGAGIVVAPSWDFDTDAWVHSRIAIVRGVETGSTIVRVARNGALTISDPSGHVLDEARTASGLPALVLATVRSGSHDTIYDRWGDWFVTLCLLLMVTGLWRSRGRRGTESLGRTPVPDLGVESRDWVESQDGVESRAGVRGRA